MKPYKSTLIFITLLFTLILTDYASGESKESKGHKIVKKMDSLNSHYKTRSSEMKLIIHESKNKKIIRKLTGKVIEYTDGKKNLIEFTWPSDVSGIKTLTWTHKNSNNDQWLYLPALRKVKRISSKGQSGTFMGSEFTHEDLNHAEIDRFKYKFIKKEKYNKEDHWVIERYSLRKKKSYYKEKLWIHSKHYYLSKIEHFQSKKRHSKTSTYTKYKKLNKWWVAQKVIMYNRQTRKKSELLTQNVQFGKTLNKNLFNKNSL